MQIQLDDLSKRFNFNWIFRNVNIHIPSGGRYVILGSNGSGKSTFIQIISGAMLPSDGKISWINGQQEITEEEIYRYVSLSAPYMELMEELTLREHIRFHFSLKKPLDAISCDEILGLSELKQAADKPLRYFSSGMKQKVKLLLAVLSDTPLLVLDEPLSNLDERASSWYENLIRQFSRNRTIIVASNHQEKEFSFCNERIHMKDLL